MCIRDSKKEGQNPFILDSKEPTESFRDFLMGEVRYAQLTTAFPDEMCIRDSVREGEIFLDLYLPYRVFLSERKSIFGSLTEDLPVRIFPYLPAVTRGFDELRIESDLGKLSDLYDEKLIAGVAVSHRGQLSFFENMPVPVIAEENFHFQDVYKRQSR